MVTTKIKTLGRLNALAHLVILGFSIGLLFTVAIPRQAFALFNFFYCDALSAFFIFVIAAVNFAAALYSVGYIVRDVAEGVISEKKARVYYLLFDLFAFSMFFVTLVNNLGMMWVSIEMTTLISAFLVGFYNTKYSVEAAWKYIIICSVGIIFALLGIILFAYAFSLTGTAKSLNWTELMKAAGHVDKNILKVAFIFILIGFGTKAGLAPMHTWLPDAHSQAIAPVSALLSGVLLKTSIYAILRFAAIVSQGPGGSYVGHLLIFFGLVSLLVSAGFVLVQRDIKRLLAYSSIEHIGIISIGLGIGGPLGLTGAFLHILNHAMTKSLMFFGAGDVVAATKKHNMNDLRGVLKTMPFTGFMLLAGVFALTGLPPFSIFISEMMIVIAAFLNGSYVVFSLFLFFIVVIFGAIVHHFGGILFGNRPADMPAVREPLSSKMAFCVLIIPIVALGIFIPVFLQRSILSAIAVIKGA